MEIYRIEHESDANEHHAPFRVGPYGYRSVFQDWYLETDTDDHPCLDAEIGRGTRTQEFFGFRDVEQLKRWFCRRHRRSLRRSGFVVRLYEGERGSETRCQSVLDAGECKPREIRTLKSSEWVE